MLKKYFVILSGLCIVLFASTAMMPKATTACVPADTISVNAFRLRFTKENGTPVNFKVGETISSLSNITITVNKPYGLTKVNVMLVRGLRPVCQQAYSGTQEVVIDKNFFIKHGAQQNDRLIVELLSVTVKKDGEEIPVLPDVSVFNIPLN
jgi:hypothetical protein